ncbi:diguanylate cyclase [Accumulibacter sp.]|uniref:diguanylate cyclase n=1 Tax=Accumulibacter sp. TaxID=2053492 RepID=UPI0035AFA647
MSGGTLLVDEVVGEALVPMAGLLRLLMPTSAVGFALKGLDGRYRLANPAIEELLCRPGERLTGRSEEELMPAAACSLLAECDRQILAGEASAWADVELACSGQNRHYSWLKMAILAPDRTLQAIASLVEPARQQASLAIPETLRRLQEANRDLQQMVIELELVASTDRLTGAWNRRRLEESVHSEMERMARYGHSLCLLLIDVDRFKPINDQYGHAVGDAVLQRLTALLQAALRKVDSLSRWGGEEFVVLCPNTARATAAAVAERLRREVATAHFATVDNVTVSIGVAECATGESWEEWFARADAALYRAKSEGRNQVRVAPELAGQWGSGGYVVANFVQLVWRAAYECGNEIIDRGHRQLFADANRLLAAMLSDQPAEQLGPIVDQLLTDVVEHFRDEEAVIGAAGFPATAEHLLLHQALTAEAHRLLDHYRSGTRGVGDVFQFLAYEVVTKHMLGADRLFFDYLRPEAAGRPGTATLPGGRR